MITLYLSLIISILILIFIYLCIKFKEDLDNFENIHLDIGNAICSYFFKLGLSILKKEDYTNDNYYGSLYNDHFFFKSLPQFIKYEYDDIYNCLNSKNITYDNFGNQYDVAVWEINSNNKYEFWNCMKPLVHKILDDTFKQCDLVKNVDNPIIHFRCADTPFIKQDGYHFQYYTFFKNSLKQISTKLNKKYNKVDIMSCSFHHSGKEQQDSCGIYAKSLQEYLSEIGYQSNIICNSNIDDFASLFYAPAVISTHSSFSFMSGFFGKGMFISTEFQEGKKCEDCNDFTEYGYNLMHNQVDDYNNTDTVINLLKQK